MSRRAGLVLSLVLALAVFAAVQDRITAAGARSYVGQQRNRLAAGEQPIALAGVMEPAIERSVRVALLSAAGVLAAGIVVSLLLRRPA
jgi:hypothetical protein